MARLPPSESRLAAGRPDNGSPAASVSELRGTQKGGRGGVVFTPQRTVRVDELADLLAATLVHREPGWRLPRRSALARKYNVGLAEIDAAIDNLADRALIRRLPDGQLYRTSPVDYWIPVEGMDGLATRLDPMGNTINRQTRQVSRHAAPSDVAGALGLPDGAQVRAVYSVWSAGNDPVAISSAYRQEPRAGDGADRTTGRDGEPEFGSFASLLNPLPPVSVAVEMGPARAAAAETLRLPPGYPAITVTLRFDDATSHTPVGLTVVTLRPELFRVTVLSVFSGG